MSQCRLAHDALPDGNCMFHALSHQLYGGDQHHVHVRSMLLEVIESNKIIYQPYWIEDTPWGKTTFNEHLQKVALVGSWGTQVELQAVSDCFNVTVFVCSPNPSGIVQWEKKTTPKNHDNINIPAMSLQATLPFTHSHIELCYSNYPYKSILPGEKGTQLSPQEIIPRCSHTVITIN